ncbi:hypothetical protein D3C79_888810 [compost metagenome]
MQVQRFHFTDHNQVITGSVFRMNLAIKPMQAAGNDRIAKRRMLPFDATPLVRASPSKLVGNLDLLTRQDIDCKPACLANFGVAGRVGHHAEGHQRRVH